MSKPRVLYLEATRARELLANPDALSCSLVVFRNGTADEGDSVPFVELTPELLRILRSVDWGRDGSAA